MPAAPVVAQKASDHALLEGTLAGDEDAFAELVARYRNQITSYIYRMTNDYDGAVEQGADAILSVVKGEELKGSGKTVAETKGKADAFPVGCAVTFAFALTRHFRGHSHKSERTSQVRRK